MSALPKSRNETSDAVAAGSSPPPLQLHRCRLDYQSAMSEHMRGGCAARVAIAAGSKATSRRNLRRVGLKIVEVLKTHYDVFERFDRLGYSLDDFCRGVIEQTEATRTKRVIHEGRVVAEYESPDWPARTAAREQYMRSTGMLKLPLASDSD